MSTGGELVPSAGGSPFVLSAPDWAHVVQWRGKLNILHTLQGSPVGRDQEQQQDYATLLASWLNHEGPLPPPIAASPDRKKRREKQQAKKQVGPVCVGDGSGEEREERMRGLERMLELECRVSERFRAGDFQGSCQLNHEKCAVVDELVKGASR